MQPDQFTISIKLSPMQYKLLYLAAGDPETFRQQQRCALSLSVKKNFGELYQPLIEGDIQNNMPKVLINLFSYSVLEGLDLVPFVDRDSLLELNAEILKGISEKENILNVIRSLGPEEKKELFQEFESNQQ